MAYALGGAVARGDLNGVVVEAFGAERVYIGAKALPAYEVDLKAGHYPKFKKGQGELMNADINPRAQGGSYKRVIRAYTFDNYTCFDRGVEEAIDDADEKDLTRFFDLEQLTAKHILREIMLAHEIRVQAQIQSTGNFDTSVSSPSAAYTIAQLANIDVGLDVSIAKAALINRGEVGPGKLTLILSSAVFERLKATPKLQARIHGFVAGGTLPFVDLNEDLMAKALGVDQILVGRAAYNSAGKGKDFVTAAVWNNTYMWLGYCAEGDFFAGGAGRTMVWNKEGGLWVTEAYRDEQHRSDILRVRQNTAEKISNAAAGTLLVTSYS